MFRAAVIAIGAGLTAAGGSADGLAVPAPGVAGGITAGAGTVEAPRHRASGSKPAAVTLGPLDEPSAVDVDRDGAIFVAEAGASRVSVFDSRGRLERRWGRLGDGAGELRRPRGIAIAPDGRVYLADTGHHRVQVYSAAGVLERTWGRWGTGPGEFNEPLGIAVDERRV